MALYQRLILLVFYKKVDEKVSEAKRRRQRRTKRTPRSRC